METPPISSTLNSLVFLIPTNYPHPTSPQKPLTMTTPTLAPLHLKLTRLALNDVDDVAGRWQFEGGSVAQGSEHVANYASTKRVTYKGTDQNGQNTASVTTTIFFLGKHPPETVTLEGAHDFSSGNQTGSVSAASSAQAAHVGKQYTRNGATGDVQIL